MTAHELEIILTRQWADSLSIPVFLTDIKGDLLFYNLPAEDILGKRFEESGGMTADEWSILFTPKMEDGTLMDPADLPLIKTLNTRKPAQGSFWIDSLQGEKHHLNVTSFPIIGMSGGYLGAVAIFWTNHQS